MSSMARLRPLKKFRNLGEKKKKWGFLLTLGTSRTLTHCPQTLVSLHQFDFYNVTERPVHTFYTRRKAAKRQTHCQAPIAISLVSFYFRKNIFSPRSTGLYVNSSECTRLRLKARARWTGRDCSRAGCAVSCSGKRSPLSHFRAYFVRVSESHLTRFADSRALLCRVVAGAR